MSKLLLSSILVLSLTGEVFASDIQDTTVSIYGVGSSEVKQDDKKQESSTGVGIMIDSDKVKVKGEFSSDFIRTGAIVKFNPYDGKFYIKVGANYISQTMYAPDSTSDDVNQYSGALATGYMMMDDLYIELGGSYTNLSGSKIGVDYEMVDETTKQAYIEVAKRWETGFGTLDTSANVGQVYHEYTSNKGSYGLGVDYYPVNNAKIGYKYQYEENNVKNTYSAQYSYFFIEYTDNISRDTYDASVGVSIAFDNLFDISTYKAPTNIKSQLSGLHKFEQVVFTDNMRIQSTAGVTKTQEAIDRDSAAGNVGPTWTASSYATGITVDDTTNSAVTIQDLTAVSSDADAITYSIVSVTAPVGAEQTIWDNSVDIDGSNVLVVKNLTTNNPGFNGTVSAVIRATSVGGTSDTTVSWAFNNVN